MRKFVDLLAPWRHRCQILAITLLCATAGLAHAQTANDDNSADPPSRVARLSYISGDLGFLPAGATDWSDASVNRPLTTGDRLSTGQGSRAELELGGGAMRMAGRTEFGVLELSDQIAQFELTEGSLNITVRDLDEGQSYEIDTPTVALVIDQPGTFRVDIDDEGGSSSTRVTAFDGRATVYGENNAQRTVLAGRVYRFVDSSLAAVAISDIGGGDAFDTWSAERNHMYAQSDASRYVPDDVVGSQDLDQYGDWQDAGDYGEVWFPTRVTADWAPYRDGHWAYIAPWGWTWVDNSPWGFAPYHYGRWAYLRGHWGWIPGPRGVRSIYAPALVAFVGGGGWSVGIGGAPVGWFPLGPGEIYNPWYRCGRRCYTDVNFNNIRGRRGYDRDKFIEHIHDRYNHFQGGMPVRGEHYANRDAPRGFTAVPGQAFAGGRNVRHDLLRVDPRQLAAAPVLARGTNVRPAPGSLAPSRSPHARDLPTAGLRRDVVARHAPLDMPAAGRAGVARGQPGARRDAAIANVRMLNPGSAAARDTRPATFDRASHGSDNPTRFSRNPALMPAANAAARASNGQGAIAPDAAEMRSARFAHPTTQSMPDRANPYRRQTTRPVNGNVANGGDRQPREAWRGQSTLPQVPQIQRATQLERTTSAVDEGNPHVESARAMRYSAPSDSPNRGNIEPRRFDQGDNARQADFRGQPRPVVQPVRSEPVRQNYQPRYEPPQRAAAQAYRPQPQAQSHAERATPARAESRPAGRSAPRGKDDPRDH
jgi:hypothetical protein